MFRTQLHGLRHLYTSVKPRPKPSWRHNLSGPLFKSLLLTLVFGSAVAEASKRRKGIESLEAAYDTRFNIINETIRKLKQGEPVDVAAEVKIANAITRNKYNSVSDVELDEQFDELLQLAENQEETQAEPKIPQEKKPTTTSSKPDERSFL